MPPTKHLRLVLPVHPTAPVDATMSARVDVLGQLRGLGALRTAGLLTQEEYEAKRAVLRALLDDLDASA
jgi:hypothetical protein